MAKTDIKIFRRWALLLGGLSGFGVVLFSDIFLDKDVNYGVYVLLAGMMGLDSVLNRTEEEDASHQDDNKPDNNKQE
jgi:hypothetical protein